MNVYIDNILVDDDVTLDAKEDILNIVKKCNLDFGQWVNENIPELNIVLDNNKNLMDGLFINSIDIKYTT